MAVLKNPKHELLAQELAKGKTATEAMQVAGYSDPRNSTRLTKKDEIRARVTEIQQAGAVRAEITRESLMDEAAEIQRKATAAEQFAAANGALKLKAELSGHYVQRKEDVTPRRHSDQIDARIRELLGLGGEGRAAEPAGRAGAGSEGDEAIPTVPGHGTA